MSEKQKAKTLKVPEPLAPGSYIVVDDKLVPTSSLVPDLPKNAGSDHVPEYVEADE